MGGQRSQGTSTGDCPEVSAERQCSNQVVGKDEVGCWQRRLEKQSSLGEPAHGPSHLEKILHIRRRPSQEHWLLKLVCLHSEILLHIKVKQEIE